MARRFKNRSTKEIVFFLEAHGFFKANIKGDDAIYCKKGFVYTVKVTLNREATPIGTMMQIAKMTALCGVSKSEWLRWWKTNGFGE